MPYIEQEYRFKVDQIVKYFLDTGKIHGRLNYFLFKLTKEAIKRNGESYGSYKEIIGELECAKLEIYRKLVSNYEDKKEKENGEIE